VTIELAALAKLSVLASNRFPIVLNFKTDLLSMWLLFPESRPYRTYSLVHERDIPAPAIRSSRHDICTTRKAILGPPSSAKELIARFPAKYFFRWLIKN
jgi:hypothetical protein